ncbi:MAG: MFS transporter [Chloroflexota bacterium]|nr:MAG: MFS transporter [Chloroflexota bacterium]
MSTASELKRKLNIGWKIPFFTIWTGQAFSLLGSSLVGFALIWWMTDTTGSATVLATAATIEFLPKVFVGPFAGALVDRWNRRLVMLAADSITALATAALIYLIWAGNLQIWHIYALMLVRSTAGAFHVPAMLSSTSLMVPEDQLTRVQGINQLLQGLMNIAAPILGAFLLALIPLHSVLSVDLLTAALAILPLLFINIPQPKREESPDQIKTSVLGDIRDGFRYVWNWIGLRNVIFIAVTVNLVTIPAITLMPLLVKNEFSGGVMEVASMQSALAVGFLVGGVLLSVWGGFKRKIRTTTMGMFGTALGLLVVGLAHTVAFQLALAGIFIAGLMNVIVNGPAIALLQTLVAENMQGRVLSLVISLANAMTPLGLLLAGPLADRTGVNTMFILASLIFVISGIFTLVNAPLRNIETNHRDEARAQESTTSALGTT